MMNFYRTVFTEKIIYSSSSPFFNQYLVKRPCVLNEENLDNIKDLWSASSKPAVLINKSLNTVRDINLFLDAVYPNVTTGTLLLGFAPTSLSTKKRILSKHADPLNKIAYLLHFMRHRVMTKLTRSSSKLHDMHYSEILGRIAAKGFSIIDFTIDNDVLMFSANKTPVKNITNVSQGIIFKMPRVGKNGKTINVYKIRTMHAYAEYLQDFILTKNGLDNDGKFRNDFRIASWGKFLRRYWIDELPMIINLLKGDIKLVGVRPISEKYLKLYPEDVKELRLKAKPGLIPPSYADSAGSLDDIVRLEKIYLLKQRHHPFTTDIKYLAKIISNLFVKKIRSK